MVTGMGFPRVYALRHAVVDRLVQLRLEQVAGPVIRALDKHDATLNVVVVPTPPCVVESAGPALERKRARYWARNPERNARIAAVAQALVAKKWKALRALGVEKHNVPKTTNRPLRVAILVESTEHGRELGALLPVWALRSALSPTETVKTKTTATPGASVSPTECAQIVSNTTEFTKYATAPATEMTNSTTKMTKLAGKSAPALSNMSNTTQHGATSAPAEMRTKSVSMCDTRAPDEIKKDKTATSTKKSSGGITDATMKATKGKKTSPSESANTKKSEGAKKSPAAATNATTRLGTKSAETGSEKTAAAPDSNTELSIVTVTYAARNGIRADVLMRTRADSLFRDPGFPRTMTVSYVRRS